LTPSEYNASKFESGDLTGGMIAALVERFQEEMGLAVDGMCGPITRAALLSPTDPPTDVSEVAFGALRVAIESIGKGEEGGNNSGEFVEMLHQKHFDGNNDDDGAWCAAFMSHCFEESCSRLDVEMPFLRSGGAKKLFRHAWTAGRLLEGGTTGVERLVLPGDLVCWYRGDPTGWMGHIGIVERTEGELFFTIEGNVGRYPSKVRRFRHTFDEPRLIGFARV